MFSKNINEVKRSILNDLLSRFKDITERIKEMENRMANIGKDLEDVKLLMSFPGVDVYSALAIYSEIGDISKFPDKDHFASYTGLVPKVDQSGEREVHGKITKKGPSILRFIIVNSVHTLIKLSPRFKKIYLRLVRRLGKKKALIALARRFATMIYEILKTKKPYIESFEELYVRKLKKMEFNAKKAVLVTGSSTTESLINSIDITHLSKEPFS
jgi:transposase